MPTEKVGAVLCSSCELPGMMQPKGAVTSQGLQLPRAEPFAPLFLPISASAFPPLRPGPPLVWLPYLP